jgi:hypothetical protein
MNAGEARALARRWMAEEVARAGGEVLCGFTGGSINEMADQDPFPRSSDLDLIVVVPKFDPARHSPKKRPYQGLAIEAVYLPRDRFLSAEALLGDFALGPQLAAGTLLFDPEGTLQGLRAAMAPQFARRRWMRLRCRAVRDKALSLIQTFESSTSYVYLVAVAFHAVRCMAQMALLADLRNPTVKKALVKARTVFAEYGLAEEHQHLLRLIGCDGLDSEAILRITSHCLEALDQACHWFRTPFETSHMVSVHARPSLTEDVPACVTGGTGREIFVWVGTLYGFAMMAVQNDAPTETAAAALQIFAHDMARIGAGTPEAARMRMLAFRPALERMTALCDDIMAGNPRSSEP